MISTSLGKNKKYRNGLLKLGSLGQLIHEKSKAKRFYAPQVPVEATSTKVGFLVMKSPKLLPCIYVDNELFQGGKNSQQIKFHVLIGVPRGN